MKTCKYCNGTGKYMVKAKGENQKVNRSLGYKWHWKNENYPDASKRCPKCNGTGFAGGNRK